MINKGIIVLFVFFLVAGCLLCWLFTTFGANIDAAIAVAMAVIVSVGGLLLDPIRDDLGSFFDNLFIKKEIYRICIFGRAGSGKSTLIETSFTLTEPDRIRRSTEAFDYYNFKVQLGLKKFIDVAIADYKGQNPSQIILNSPEDFFGEKGNRVVNALLFIVDLVPRKVDDQGNAWSDEILLEWLKNGDTIEKIESRVEEHYEYIGEGTLELLFASLYSENLKSVRFLINKLDLVDQLVDNGYMSLSGFKTAQDYTLSQFEVMIKNVTRACSELKIDDFSISTISAKDNNDLRFLMGHLLDKRN
jgi:hypothetical protein